MADVQLEDGYVQIVNSLYEALYRLRIPGRHKDVIHCVIRFTFGWHKTRDTISISQIATATTINERGVRRLLGDLVEWRVIGRESKGRGRPAVLWIVKDFDAWEVGKTSNAKHGFTAQPRAQATGRRRPVKNSQPRAQAPQTPGADDPSTPGAGALLQRHKHNTKDMGAAPAAKSFEDRFPSELFPDFKLRPEKFYIELASPAGNPLGRQLTPEQVADWNAWQFCVRGLCENKPRGMTTATKRRWGRLNRYEDELEASRTWASRVRDAPRFAELEEASDAQPDAPPPDPDFLSRLNITTLGSP